MNDTLRRSCKSIFVEVAKFFLRFGVSYQDLQDVLKHAVVEAAVSQLASGGAQVSSANVAEKVGLPRRVVTEIRSTAADVAFQTERAVPAGVMLKIWHNDSRYLDQSGQPVELSLEDSKGGVSILTLAKDAKCAAPIDKVLESLISSGSVKEVNEKIRVRTRTFIMSPDDENTILYFGIAGSNLLSTLVHNTSESSDPPFFERTTWVSGLNRAVFPRFSELVSETSVPFLELLDDWLMHRQGQVGDGRMEGAEDEVLGVGVYVFNRQDGLD